jgi:anionic cell wall polymer biosynthesis LytR-Cps2A-Psr (LCP) family protein
MEPDNDALDGDDDLAVRRVRRGEGPRAQQQRALQSARRASRRRTALRAVGAVAALSGIVVFGPRVADAVGPVGITVVDAVVDTIGDTIDRWGDTIAGWSEADEPSSDTSQSPREMPSDVIAAGRTTTLFATFNDAVDGDAGARTTGLQLLTADPVTGSASVSFVPVSLVTDVPGYGPIQLADAAAFGGVPLVKLAVENALGLQIDGTLTMTEQSWGALFARVGGYEVDVRQPLSRTAVDGSSLRRFEVGPQFLDGPRLAELLVFEHPGASELAQFPRAQQVLEGFFTKAAESENGVDPVFNDGAPMLSSPTPAVIERIMRALVDAARRDDLDVRTLPVTAMGAGIEAYYRIDGERSIEFVNDVFGGVRGADSATAGVRLEVLNGNGAVGIGAEVAARLVPLGHTVVITRNADGFGYSETVVRLHGSSDELLAIGAQIVKTLGVGRVEISTVQSSTVDVTIVVGADFQG